MTKYFALVLAVLFAACSQTPSAPPLADAATFDRAAIGAGIADPTGLPLCGDEPCPDPSAPQKPPIKAKLDARTPAQIAAAACRRSDGSWACPAIPRPLMASGGNATAANCGPACTVSSWYFDPQDTTTCASDANSCTSATCAGAGVGPCLTYQQIVTRLGSTQAVYPFAQSATVFELSPQTTGTDPIFGEYRMSGGGQSNFDCRQAWVQAGAAFSSGAVSGGTGYVGATRGAGTAMFTIAGMPGYVVNNTLLNNTTRASYAFVDNAGTGVVTQPQTVASLTTTTALPAPAEDNDWAALDSIQPETLPLTNLKKWSPVGSDVAASTQPSVGWVIGCRIADPSGSHQSLYIHSGRTASAVLSTCWIDERLNTTAEGGRGFETDVAGCIVSNGTVVVAGQTRVFGGSLNGVGGVYGNAAFVNDAILHGTTVAAGIGAGLGTAFSDGTITMGGGSGVVSAGDTVWGSYAVSVLAGGFYINTSNSTFALKALLTNGALKLGTLSTGCSPPASGTYASNGSTQVDTACAFGTVAAPGNCFPATAPISISLATAVSPSPQFFSAPQTAGTFHTKGTAGDTSTYNWTAGRVCGISITQAVLDYTTGFGSLCNIPGDACFSNAN